MHRRVVIMAGSRSRCHFGGEGGGLLTRLDAQKVIRGLEYPALGWVGWLFDDGGRRVRVEVGRVEKSRAARLKVQEE